MATNSMVPQSRVFYGSLNKCRLLKDDPVFYVYEKNYPKCIFVLKGNKKGKFVPMLN
jgi:hypothetical protein